MAERLAIIGGDAAGMSRREPGAAPRPRPRHRRVRARAVHVVLGVRHPLLPRRRLRRPPTASSSARPRSTASAGSTCASAHEVLAHRPRRARAHRSRPRDAHGADRAVRPARHRHRRGRRRAARPRRRRGRARAHRRRRRALRRARSTRGGETRSSSAPATSASRWPRRSSSAACGHDRRAGRPGHARRARPRHGRSTSRTRAEAEGIDVRLGRRSTEIEPRAGPDAVRAGGERFPADHVVLATGVKPASDREEAGLELGESGGLLVDDHQRCPADGVFAAGDCVESLAPPARAAGQRPARHARQQAGPHRRHQRDRRRRRVPRRHRHRGRADLQRARSRRTGLTEPEAPSTTDFDVVAATSKSTTRAGLLPRHGPDLGQARRRARDRPPARRADRRRRGRGQARRRARRRDLDRA